ncbi:hypothetical protein NA57DRAFT_51681 [Rhizodiscina lignyota]|uniref:BZIP domain-containing protein n=1 Tax=Rhizodiscina lignyota TaxID=1504668 RepID=A0A9P4IRP2_9PEZI|nr:hypothetical protein NA57DRAFT_51681 [Rhizodiscina lignyota]
MDYTSYFAATPQALSFFGLPPTPSYVDDGKLPDSAVDSVDSAFFPPYDTFRFSSIPAQAQNHTPHTQTSPLITTSAGTTGAPDASPTSLGPSVMPPVGSVDSGLGMDSLGGMGTDPDNQGRTRSSSEEKETLTPAQSRRKAQNRAAQRAFRERKERHVRDLEAKLSALESSATSLATDNERLKLALQRATTENEILRATTSNAHRLSLGSMDGSESNMRTLGGVVGAGMGLQSETSAGNAVAAAQALLARSESTSGPNSGDANHDTSSSLENGSIDPSNLGTGAIPTNPLLNGNPVNHYSPTAAQRSSALLHAAQTWDLIQAHPLVKQGVVDIADVCEALRGTARCDGHGPVFREESVWRAVEGARRGGGDELI